MSRVGRRQSNPLHARDAGSDGYVDYIVDTLQVTRPQRIPNLSSATSWTPEFGL